MGLDSHRVRRVPKAAAPIDLHPYRADITILLINKPALLFATVTFVALLLLVGCAGPTGPSGSDEGAGDPGDGASSTTEYGINLVNTGSGDFEVSYLYSFCRAGESANDCVTRGFGAGFERRQMEATQSLESIGPAITMSITISSGRSIPVRAISSLPL